MATRGRHMRRIRRTHVSPDPPPLWVRETDRIDRRWSSKPFGLWYEVNSDWRWWCRQAGLTSWLAGRYLYALDLGGAKMLCITNASELDQFEERWGDYDRVPAMLVVRWADLREEFDGIEIAPHMVGRWRPSSFWYDTWDCASGCIWRPNGASLKYVGQLGANGGLPSGEI